MNALLGCPNEGVRKKSYAQPESIDEVHWNWWSVLWSDIFAEGSTLLPRKYYFSADDGKNFYTLLFINTEIGLSYIKSAMNLPLVPLWFLCDPCSMKLLCKVDIDSSK